MQDIEEELNKGRMRVGVLLEANLHPQNSGVWETLSNGSKLWRLKISSSGALGLNLYFDDFFLPEGATLYIYSPDYKHIIGAFTEFNNQESKAMATQVIDGEELMLELLLPNNINPDIVALNISEVGYKYRGFGINHNSKSTKAADTCLVNINCPEGNNWQQEKRGVVKLLMRIGMANYECSGSLVNNTYQNCIPYVLTAFHCGDGATALNLNQWIIYFGYEATTCNATTGLANKTSIGCTLIATDNWNGSLGSTSDFYLIRLKNSIPASYQPYYNGWSRTESASTSGVGIHHPQGDIKKISTFNTTLSNHINFWGVTWVSTVTNHSVTEVGSSGSPLFNANKQIIGTLTGGWSYCNKPTEKDLYGKFFKHWDQGGSTPQKQLKPWLDPAGTNPITLAGVNFTNCTSISVEEHIKPNLAISVYPNPASTFIHVKFENYYFINGSIQVYDILGNALIIQNVSKYEETFQLSVESLPIGIYMLVAKDNQRTFSKTFVKQ